MKINQYINNKFAYACLALAAANTASAQHNNEFYNKGAVVHIQAGAEVHVLGDVHNFNSAGNVATLENYGTLQVHGDMYSDNLFQQRGTGTTRLQNNIANVGQAQKISGSYAVRGASSANKGSDDGSFYTLELANDVGMVYLEPSAAAGSTPYVADVRNGVDFWMGAGTAYNRIITMPAASITPLVTNGSDYTAVFGIMNPSAVFSMPWGEGGMRDNSTDLGSSNMSTVDAGYVQGKLRRQIDPAGGIYPFVLGLDPAGASDARGMQYIQLHIDANTYDVIQSHFQNFLSNSSVGAVIECPSNYQVDFWGGDTHGQWVFDDATGAGAGNYMAKIWPQDHNFPAKTIWFVTKDNSVQGTADQCGPTYIGLERGGFNGFSTIGEVASDILLETAFTNIAATPIENHYIRVSWTTSKEQDVDHFVIERSLDDAVFQPLTTHTAVGNSATPQSYFINDMAVLPNTNYYYRIKTINIDGSYDYTYSVVASIQQDGNSEAVRVFPNPVNGDQINVEISAVKDRNFRFVVYDAIGQRVYQSSATMSVGLNQYSLPTKDWASGAYFLHIIGDEFSSIQEIIKRMD